MILTVIRLPPTSGLREYYVVRLLAVMDNNQILNQEEVGSANE